MFSFPTFFNRIYNCPQYTVIRSPHKRVHAPYLLIPVAAIGIILLALLALAGGIKTVVDTAMSQLGRNLTVLYLCSPILAVIAMTLTADMLHYVRERL